MRGNLENENFNYCRYTFQFLKCDWIVVQGMILFFIP